MKTNNKLQAYNDGWSAGYSSRRRPQNHGARLTAEAEYAAGFSAGQQDRDLTQDNDDAYEE